MLHKEYYRKSSVGKRSLWSWVPRVLTPRQTDWRQTSSRKVTLTLTLALTLTRSVQLSGESQTVNRRPGGWCEIAASLEPSQFRVGN
jgi:hypothetical protein